MPQKETTMTDQTPLERAAAAIDENYNPDQAPILAAMFQDYARTVFESIDTDELATVIGDNLTARNADGFIVVGDSAHIAQAVKDWLTGKDNQ